jgi:hypothetical protein
MVLLTAPRGFTGNYPDPGNVFSVAVRPRIWGAAFTAFVIFIVLAGCINPAGSNGVTPTAASLAYGSWVNGNLVEAEQVDRYEFTAAAGVDYLLQWEDRYHNGDGSKTAYLYVSAYKSDGSTIFSYVTGGSRSFNVSSNDTIYIEIRSIDSNYIGTYALMYYDLGIVSPQGVPSSLRVVGIPLPACGISWGSVAGATDYELYRSTVSADFGYDDTPVYSGTGTSYIDNGVTPGISYWYKVRAVNSIGNGPLSAAVSDTPAAAGTETALAPAAWMDGAIDTTGEVDWYTFTASAGTTYLLQWDDRYNSAGGKTAYSYVSAYKASDWSMISYEHTSGYSSPWDISVSSTDTIYVRVRSQSSNTGTYAIRYYDPTALVSRHHCNCELIRL